MNGFEFFSYLMINCGLRYVYTYNRRLEPRTISIFVNSRFYIIDANEGQFDHLFRLCAVHEFQIEFSVQFVHFQNLCMRFVIDGIAAQCENGFGHIFEIFDSK